MRIDPAAEFINSQLSTGRRLDGELDGARKRETGALGRRAAAGERSRNDALADRFEARFGPGEAKKVATDTPRSVRPDLSSLARAVRYSLRAFLREVGRDLDKQGFAEIKQELKALYKEFRSDLGQASRAVREDGDRKAFLEAVEGAFGRLGEGLADVIDRSTVPETPAVPDEPVVEIEVGGAQQLQRSSDPRPTGSIDDPFDSLLRVLQRRFEALYQQLRDRILPERVDSPGDKPSFSLSDGSVEAAIRAYED